MITPRHSVVPEDMSQQDEYLLRDRPRDAFDTILDVGGNIGSFSVYASMLFPDARRIALEPLPATYEVMVQNLQGFRVECYNMGIGKNTLAVDIGPKGKCDSAGHCGNVMKSSDDGGVKALLLSEMFTEFDIQGECFLKFDCETGEWELLNDPGAIPILTTCKQFGIELHWKGDYPHWAHTGTWEEYNDWIHQFESTHDIVYHKSRKSKGHGIYALRRKE